MTLEEDQVTNRLTESINLFEEVTSSQWFRNSVVILFLNKIDLFKEKIKKTPLKSVFKDYNGGNDFNSSIEYIENKYKAVFGSKQTLYIKHTCAIDTDNITHIFNSVKSSIFDAGMEMFIG